MLNSLNFFYYFFFFAAHSCYSWMHCWWMPKSKAKVVVEMRVTTPQKFCEGRWIDVLHKKFICVFCPKHRPVHGHPKDMKCSAVWQTHLVKCYITCLVSGLRLCTVAMPPRPRWCGGQAACLRISISTLASLGLPWSLMSWMKTKQSTCPLQTQGSGQTKGESAFLIFNESYD